MRRFVASLFCIILCLSLSACALSQDWVRLASKRQLWHWCQDQFGNCSVVEFTKDEHNHHGVFHDTEKDFDYTASSFSYGVGLDGATFWYQEGKSSSFDEEYLFLFENKYSTSLHDIEVQYSVVINFNTYVWMCEITGSLEDDVIEASKELESLMHEYDVRDYWAGFEYRLLVDGEDVGEYRDNIGFVSSYDETTEWFMEIAAIDMHVSENELTFIRRDTMNVVDLPGYDPDKLVCILGSDNDTKEVAEICYFEYKGEVYYIADLVQMNDDHLMYHLGTYPSDKK